jgi:hypothetical protein
MNFIAGVVSSAARVADPDDDVFENYKAGLMLERLALDLLRPYRSVAVLTLVVVHNLCLTLGHRVDRDQEVASGTCKTPDDANRGLLIALLTRPQLLPRVAVLVLPIPNRPPGRKVIANIGRNWSFQSEAVIDPLGISFIRDVSTRDSVEDFLQTAFVATGGLETVEGQSLVRLWTWLLGTGRIEPR